MHFLPILSTLRRHKTAATLIVLEIALTCAIVCNAIFLIGDRISRMDKPSGIAEDELVRVSLTGIGKKADALAETAQDMIALRSIPGVKSASPANMVPFGGSSWNSDASTAYESAAAPAFGVGTYMGGPDLVKTLGTEIIAGRDFQPDEFADFESVTKGKARMPSILLTKSVADKLFPSGNALGQKVYVWGKEPQVVVGIIDRLVRPNEPGPDAHYDAVVLPITTPFTVGSSYMIRVDPSRKAEVLAAVDATLQKIDPGRIILKRQTFAEIRKDHFKQDRAMAFLLVGVSIALLIITALGVVGLASFWVQQRTRQIGIRRALGASRGDILRYFQVENFILATLGIILGMVLAYGINLWLMDKYKVPRLPAEFLPAGAVVLWLLGQISVLGPALRAAMIPPAVATRTV